MPINDSTLTNTQKPILEVQNLKKYYPIRTALGKTKGYIKAVQDISFTIYEGETFGLVGESGCGKSTAGRSLLRLIEPTSGEAYFNGEDIFQHHKRSLKKVRKDLQMIFQDPNTSLDPRKKVGFSIEEALKIHKIGTNQERKQIALQLLKKVGFTEDHYDRFPHEFSGGQRQRIGIARALVLNPKLIICDEPVSALDVSIQAQIINLLKQLQKEFNISYLFIAHDLSVVRHIADRVGVMYLGHLVEQGNTDDIFSNPLHPYTQSLLSAVPTLNPKQKKEKIIIKGELPSPLNPPSGCVFHTRCPYAMDICKQKKPSDIKINAFQSVKCHLYKNETANLII
ncbi:ABC transporter ATP-binding protein [Niallia nealsonii]|uniref:Peptide ABC transporter ATP-binding protein n=1 Tax=Niallia nealsonii TaxID=115979 RepID=A0A2N0YY81_9BACI|nr:dipeptide ABC transporter ATP-binding protein [Niallia nealsonii]PKG22216.1 peptide ABC transporter ATP-binding protein [Niallia nealsonii]